MPKLLSKTFFSVLTCSLVIAGVSVSTTFASDEVTEFDISGISTSRDSITFSDEGVWFANATDQSIDLLDPDTGVVVSTPVSGGAPYSVVKDKTGKIWFTQYSGEQIGRLDPTDGSINYYGTGSGSEPSDVVVDSDGIIWVGDTDKDRVIAINLDPDKNGIEADGTGTGELSSMSVFDLSNSDGSSSGVSDLEIDGDENVWALETTTGSISKVGFESDGTKKEVEEYVIPQTESAAVTPSAMDISSDNTIWFTEAGTKGIGSYNPEKGIASEYKGDFSSTASLAGIAVHKNNKVFFTDSNSNLVGQLDVDTGEISAEELASGSTPLGIAVRTKVGSGGLSSEVWFAEKGSNKLGSFTAGTMVFSRVLVPGVTTTTTTTTNTTTTTPVVSTEITPSTTTSTTTTTTTQPTVSTATVASVAAGLKVKSAKLKKRRLTVKGSCAKVAFAGKLKVTYKPKRGKSVKKSVSCKSGKWSVKLKVGSRKGGKVTVSYAGDTNVLAGTASKRIKGR